MTFKKFTQYSLAAIIGIILTVVSFNFYTNEFGLFGNVKDKKIRIYEDERTIKYLLTFNWIPQNFDAFLFGPSLSDIEMDTSKIEDLKVYNISINGANISELKLPVENLIKNGRMKLMIICLDPYLTKNSGKKTSAIDPKEYWSTLGSLFTLKYYVKKYLTLKNPDRDPFIDSWYGYRHNNHDVSKKYNAQERIESTYTSIQEGNYSIYVDSTAIKELGYIFKLARQNNIKIMGYYYPRHKKITETNLYKKEYAKYRSQIENILKPEDIIIDFNTNEYDDIRNRYDTYSDGSHLSKEGGKKVIDILNTKISKTSLGKL